MPVEHTMSREEARAKHQEIKDKISALIEEAVKISEASGETFHYEPDHIGEYYPTDHEDHPYAYSDEDGGKQGDGEWFPSSWSSSSLYC